MSQFPLSSNPDDCQGFIQTYPQRLKEIEAKKALRNPEPKDKVLSRQDTAEFLQISMSTLDRYVKSRTIPFTKIGGRILFSLFKLREWLLSKETVPETWNDESFRAELIDRDERMRLAEISRRMKELTEIAQRIYKSLGEEGLKEEKNAEQKQIFHTVFEEIMGLILEEDEIRERQAERLRTFLGIDKEDK